MARPTIPTHQPRAKKKDAAFSDGDPVVIHGRVHSTVLQAGERAVYVQAGDIVLLIPEKYLMPHPVLKGKGRSARKEPKVPVAIRRAEQEATHHVTRANNALHEIVSARSR